MRRSLPVVGLLALCLTAASAAEVPKRVAIYVEGDTSIIPKFVNVCRQMGPTYGIDF